MNKSNNNNDSNNNNNSNDNILPLLNYAYQVLLCALAPTKPELLFGQ